MAFRFGKRLVTDGLVLHLDAMNRSSYPGTGTNWYDISGKNSHCTIVQDGSNPILSADGKSVKVKAIIVSYSSQYPNTLAVGDNFTWQFFQKRESTTFSPIAYLGTYVGQYSVSSNLYNVFGFTSTVYSKNSNTFSTDTTSEFFLSTLTKTNNSGLFYHNSENIGNWSNTILFDTPWDRFVINNTDDPFTAEEAASYSAVLIYNRELSAAEIKNNYDIFKQRFNS